ncbi:MAG: 30S ribosomal protein S12 methylthiotransferase RimO [Candidatus Azobacteroides sp.]|nr:30S ribosomal protein S12 methylthiotransferase RimO [Candidatus Azobacteroides sp.]
MKKNRIDIITLGCSKNIVDSERLIRQLTASGYTVKHDSDKVEGEIVVINTCGFIGDAKEESVNTILQFVDAKKKKRLKKLFVMGCLSERYLKELQEEIPEVDKFYGKFDWNGLITDLGKSYHASLRLERELTTPPHYAYVKISEGCSRTCSYCAIPIITGKHISRPMQDIVNEAKILVEKGVKEIQLIAQDLTFYGLDTTQKKQLPELVEKLSDINGLAWIRLHYAYPALFPDDLLRVMRERDNVCNYLDIAFQHISNNMLKLMRRNITRKETYGLIEKIRKDIPDIHLRTTLMVGHPGETEKDFDELKQFARDIRFERLGGFVYSDEEGTYSNIHYQDLIPSEEKQRRLDEIMSIQEEIAGEIAGRKIGQTFKTIIDREEKDYYIGRTEYDSPEVDPEVLIQKDQRLIPGDFRPVRITGTQGFDLFGEVSKTYSDVAIS